MPLRDLIAPFRGSRTLNQIAMLALAMGLYAISPVVKEYSPYREIGGNAAVRYGSSICG
jgi:hypothetical protein